MEKYRWAKLNMIEFRAPHQVGKEVAKGINQGRIRFADKHLSMFAQDVRCAPIVSLLRPTDLQHVHAVDVRVLYVS
jgi:acyl-CoA hydrolase